MLIIAIFIVLCFILVVWNKCYQELKEIKDMFRTKQLKELSDLMDDYDEKAAS